MEMVFLIIDVISSIGKLEYELSPQIICESYCTFNNFSEFNYHSEIDPIIHTIKLVSSLELMNDEYEITDEIEELLKKKYWIDSDRDQLIIAEIIITEFPDNWRERMDTTWSYWLDEIDGDHSVIGLRADEILERDIYNQPFDNGSLYYINTIKIHDAFDSDNIVINLINYSFESIS